MYEYIVEYGNRFKMDFVFTCMAPRRGDDLSELNPMAYGKFVYLYYLEFDCPVRENIVNNLSLWFYTKNKYNIEGDLTSDSSLILACDKEMSKEAFWNFPGRKNLVHFQDFIGEFVDKV